MFGSEQLAWSLMHLRRLAHMPHATPHLHAPQLPLPAVAGLLAAAICAAPGQVRGHGPTGQAARSGHVARFKPGMQVLSTRAHMCGMRPGCLLRGAACLPACMRCWHRPCCQRSFQPFVREASAMEACWPPTTYDRSRKKACTFACWS